MTAGDPHEPVLTVDGVRASLGGHTVLDDVTFGVGAGELTGLIGANGAGKTTLLRVILGLLSPSAGRVTIHDPGDRQGSDQQNGDQQSNREQHGGRHGRRKRPRVGYVPQKIALEADMPLRARDLVALGIDGHRFGISRPSASRRQTVDEMLAAVNATDFADARVGQLSGGEQQRVMMAHALISRPRLLLLDEPLASLDIRSAQEVVGLLARIAREQRIAVLLSAHDMNPLLPVMDRVVYLAAGRAVSGTAEEVVRTETLSALYGHHVEVLRVEGRVIVVSGHETDTAHHDGTDHPGHGPHGPRGGRRGRS